MSTNLKDLKRRAAELRQSAGWLVEGAQRLETQAAKQERAAAFKRISEVIDELQESNNAGEAVGEVQASLSEDLLQQDADPNRADRVQWSKRSVRYLDAFALLFQLDRNCLEEWFADVAWDFYQMEVELLDETERQALRENG